MPDRPSDADQLLKRKMQRQCEADRAVLLAGQPFTAKLLMQLNLVAVVDDRLPTAGTDGEQIFFNARFMASRSDADRRFILAHEVWHCALGHHRRQLGRQPECWNQACDYEVNALLREELGYCPEDALYHRRYRGQSAEQIYATLSAHPQRRQRGKVLDEHDLMGALGLSGDVQDADFQPQQVNAEAARRWQQRLVATAQQHQRQQGHLPGHITTLVERLRHPQVPWQSVLARFLHTTFSGDRQWLPPSRRHIYRGLYLPSHRGQQLELAVAIDTSGSCQRDLPDFLSELRGMLSAFDRVTLEILEFDTGVTQQRTLNESQLHELAHWQSLGGGGSDICPVFEALTTRMPQALVVLTDGFIESPAVAPGYPVLWCLTSDGQPPSVWGEVVQLADTCA
ncbi:VWA-like domain-containing protein [Vreelandella rituensis]|uniref:Metal-dependent peptidase n=1 Tax=Vreelandella rituensis TaxID=2282306 RepID=A0A368TP93_9GAMM|nr:VWA-like domain-containing protein [Halomonas rituensis]RCV86515.1 hypothetical protein DU506_18265 [Halomonas rituensis]